MATDDSVLCFGNSGPYWMGGTIQDLMNADETKVALHAEHEEAGAGLADKETDVFSIAACLSLKERIAELMGKSNSPLPPPWSCYAARAHDDGTNGIVFVGPQSSGKSTILARLLGWRVTGVSKDVCTRRPVVYHARTVDLSCATKTLVQEPAFMADMRTEQRRGNGGFVRLQQFASKVEELRNMAGNGPEGKDSVIAVRISVPPDPKRQRPGVTTWMIHLRGSHPHLVDRSFRDCPLEDMVSATWFHVRMHMKQAELDDTFVKTPIHVTMFGHLPLLTFEDLPGMTELEGMNRQIREMYAARLQHYATDGGDMRHFQVEAVSTPREANMSVWNAARRREALTSRGVNLSAPPCQILPCFTRLDELFNRAEGEIRQELRRSPAGALSFLRTEFDSIVAKNRRNMKLEESAVRWMPNELGIWNKSYFHGLEFVRHDEATLNEQRVNAAPMKSTQFEAESPRPSTGIHFLRNRLLTCQYLLLLWFFRAEKKEVDKLVDWLERFLMATTEHHPPLFAARRWTLPTVDALTRNGRLLWSRGHKPDFFDSLAYQAAAKALPILSDSMPTAERLVTVWFGSQRFKGVNLDIVQRAASSVGSSILDDLLRQTIEMVTSELNEQCAQWDPAVSTKSWPGIFVNLQLAGITAHSPTVSSAAPLTSWPELLAIVQRRNSEFVDKTRLDPEFIKVYEGARIAARYLSDVPCRCCSGLPFGLVSPSRVHAINEQVCETFVALMNKRVEQTSVKDMLKSESALPVHCGSPTTHASFPDGARSYC